MPAAFGFHDVELVKSGSMSPKKRESSEIYQKWVAQFSMQVGFSELHEKQSRHEYCHH